MANGSSGEPALRPSSFPDDANVGAIIDGETEGRAALLDRFAHPRAAIILILTLGGLLFWLNLGGYPLYTKGEPREAVTVFDIVNGGGVILPMRAGVEIPSKPLLMHWLAALLSILTGGVTEWSVRAPSALFAVGGMLAAYAYVRRLFDQRSALISALILGTSFQYLQAGSGARVDMTLAFFMELAFFQFIAIAEGLSANTLLLYFAIALAVLTKGPVGAALPVSAAAVWLVIYRRWEVLPRLQLWRGALIVTVVGGGWYIAAIVVGGMSFVHKQLLAENLYRLVPHGAHLGHAHPFYYEDAALLAGFMPWTPLAGLTSMYFFRNRQQIDRRFGYLLIWAAVVLLFFNLTQTKRGVYLLPLYPALGAIVAILVLRMLDERAVSLGRSIRIIARFTGAAFALLGLIGLAALLTLWLAPNAIAALLRLDGIVVPELTDQLRVCARLWLFIVVLLPPIIIGFGFLLIRARATLQNLIAWTLLATCAIVLAINLVIEPAVANTLSLKDFAARVRATAGTDPVGYFGNLDYDFAFYNGRDLMLSSPLDANGPALLVSPEDDWKLTGPRISAEYETLLRSNPTDLDGSGRMLLLRRRGSADDSDQKSPPGATTARSSQESRLLRSSPTAAVSFGNTSPVGPRRLKSHKPVISDS